MKIRIKGNSIRLRLTQSEVQQLKQKGAVNEETFFSPENKFVYSLTSADIPEIKATFLHQKITVFLPTPIATKWTDSEQISIEHFIVLNKEEKLKILVEKDFSC